jgi:formylglycine-generating enzyme required for sulfatase activity
VTPVGAYTGSASPYGTFDQGGNVWQWNETILTVVQGAIEHERGWRGGSWNYDNEHLWSLIAGNSPPEEENNFTGFRVASLVPEPGTGLLVMAGVLGLAIARRKQA